MGTASAEKYSLRWNDFEHNVSRSFADLRANADFFDVTLSTDDDDDVTLQAHRVILSACSPFFRNLLLKQSLSSHPHPLLYLRGITATDLRYVLDFMYNGEVNVSQDELDHFLKVAESLRIKGLTQNNENASSSSSSNSFKKPKIEPAPSTSTKRPSDHQGEVSKKRSRIANAPKPQSDEIEEDDIQEVTPVKTELGSAAAPAPPEQVAADMGLAEVDESGFEGAEGEYADYGGAEGYEDDSGDMSYGDDGAVTAGTSAEAGGSGGGGATKDDALSRMLSEHTVTSHRGFLCLICNAMVRHKRSIQRHMTELHLEGGVTFCCPRCSKTYGSKNSFTKHIYVAHPDLKGIDYYRFASSTR